MGLFNWGLSKAQAETKIAVVAAARVATTPPAPTPPVTPPPGRREVPQLKAELAGLQNQSPTFNRWFRELLRNVESHPIATDLSDTTRQKIQYILATWDKIAAENVERATLKEAFVYQTPQVAAPTPPAGAPPNPGHFYVWLAPADPARPGESTLEYFKVSDGRKLPAQRLVLAFNGDTIKADLIALLSQMHGSTLSFLTDKQRLAFMGLPNRLNLRDPANEDLRAHFNDFKEHIKYMEANRTLSALYGRATPVNLGWPQLAKFLGVDVEKIINTTGEIYMPMVVRRALEEVEKLKATKEDGGTLKPWPEE